MHILDHRVLFCFDDFSVNEVLLNVHYSIQILIHTQIPSHYIEVNKGCVHYLLVLYQFDQV